MTHRPPGGSSHFATVLAALRSGVHAGAVGAGRAGRAGRSGCSSGSGKGATRNKGVGRLVVTVVTSELGNGCGGAGSRFGHDH